MRLLRLSDWLEVIGSTLSSLNWSLGCLINFWSNSLLFAQLTYSYATYYSATDRFSSLSAFMWVSRSPVGIPVPRTLLQVGDNDLQWSNKSRCRLLPQPDAIRWLDSMTLKVFPNLNRSVILSTSLQSWAGTNRLHRLPVSYCRFRI